MSKLLKLVGGLILLYLLLMGGSGLAIQAMLSGGVGQKLRAKAQSLLPVEVSIEGGDFDLKEWFFFRPAIGFDQLRVANPPGYSDEPLLVADRIAARADLSSLLDNAVSIQSIEILAPHLRVEADAKGRTNIDALLQALSHKDKESSAPPADPAGEEASVSVGSFLLDDGVILYTAPNEEPLTVRNIRVQITDFDPESEFGLQAALDVFEDAALKLGFDGRTGPFTPKSSPTNGTLTIEGFPEKLPARFREQYLGNFLLAPGAGSRLAVTADLAGDLLGVLTGKGSLRFENLELGKPDEERLPLNGDADILLTLMNPLSNPSYHVIMPDAELSLGAGKWQGGVEVQVAGGRMEGKSTGSVTGVDVNQMLTAFSDAKDVVFGQMRLERYDLSFAGSTSEQIKKTLKGSGRLELSDGKLAVFDVLQTVEKFVSLAWTGEQQASGFTSFVRFGTDFTIADERINTPDLLLENDAARIGGKGSIGFGGDDLKLDYDISSLITGVLADKLGGPKNADGVAQLAVPIRVKGAAAAPLVYVDVKSLAKKQAVDQATRILGGLLGGKKKAEEGEAGAEQAPAEKPRLPFNLEGLFNKKKPQ
ncbi:MAG: hypothetical protein GC160_07745 [Acidobacteria bacterium]|nr:hypothetical protein [Acidobacteriota bacterium]